MSGSEKRIFKLYSNKQGGERIYLDLFEMLDNSGADIQQKFTKKFPGKNFENACRYLLKLVTDSLVNTRKEKDKWFQQYQCLMRSRILMERSISHQAYKELKHAQNLALELQDNLIYYFTCFLDMRYWSDAGFIDKSEDEIVQMHVNAKSALRLVQKILDQSSLFDTLKYRGLHSGKSFSKKDDEKLNDLLISELSLITREFHDNFESNKLHLLFQSFFFINSGDYRASLKCFYELNELFEKNESVWNFPPYEYQATLEGILDNLRTIRHYDEMSYYIEKLEKLAEKNYPENFRTTSLQTIFIYRLTALLHTQKFTEAKLAVQNIPSYLLKDATVFDFEKLAELHFNISLIHFHEKKYSKAIRQLNFINKLGKVNFNLSVYKVSRLIQIVIHYELHDLEYLEYEIRSYKRTFKKMGKASFIEHLVLSVIKFDPHKKSNPVKSNYWKKVSGQIETIMESRYEKQILKYYDFAYWIKCKLT
jgi:hypothetical protein